MNVDFDFYGDQSSYNSTPDFEDLPDSMIYSVYVDWFLSPPTGLLVEYSLYDNRIRIVDYIQDAEEKVHVFDTTYEFDCDSDIENKRLHEELAITKATELYNNRK